MKNQSVDLTIYIPAKQSFIPLRQGTFEDKTMWAQTMALKALCATDLYFKLANI